MCSLVSGNDNKVFSSLSTLMISLKSEKPSTGKLVLMQLRIHEIFNVRLIKFHCPKKEIPGKIKIPPLFKEMGFGRPSAIRHPKGLWSMEIW